MPDKATQLADGVWRIPTMPADLINSYAVRGADGAYTLIDTGTKKAAPKIMAGLAAIGVRPEQVTSIVLTHAHPDHAGSAAEVAGLTGAGVWAHEREAVYLRDGRGPAANKNSRIGRFLNRMGSKIAKVEVAGDYRDGEVVGPGLRVVHTPGHSPGHVSLVHEPTGVLITGDAIFNVRRITWPMPFVCTDPELNRRSADVLGELDYEVAAFTHGPEITDGAREAVRAFLRGKQR